MESRQYTLEDDYELAKLLFNYDIDFEKYDFDAHQGRMHRWLSQPTPQSDYDVLVALRGNRNREMWPAVYNQLEGLWFVRGRQAALLQYQPGDYAKAIYSVLCVIEQYKEQSK